MALDPYWAALEQLFNTLADPQSRQLLINLLAFRILGYRRVRLPLSTPAYWAAVKRIEALAIAAPGGDHRASRVIMDGLGGASTVRLSTHRHQCEDLRCH